jgi:hypothetical protein
MNEHEDDLAPEVREEAEEETEAFPNTADDVDSDPDPRADQSLPDLDEDKSEL